MAWGQAVWGLPAPRSVVGGIVLALALAAGVAALWAPGADGDRAATWRMVVGGLLGGAVAGLLWEPCVGPGLGDVLTRAPSAPGATLLPMLGYVAGALLPVLVLGSLPRALSWRPPLVVARTGVVATTVLALLLALGLADDVVSVLVRRSI